jgi:hypothetical protein
VPVASRLHWRLLIGTILVLFAAAWLAPRFVHAPDVQENRVLAAKPERPHGLSGFDAFRKQADAYVADHFPARPHLIGGLNRLRMLIGVSGSSRVIVGRDGWLFFDDDTHLGAARADPPMSTLEIRNWLLNLAGRTEAVRARGAPYLVVSPPVKETIYPRRGPRWFHGPNPNRPAILLPRLAQASGAGEVLYLHPQVAAATKAGEKTYSLHDTHWTGYGAYAGYVGLMNRLHAMGLTERPLPFSAFQRVPNIGKGPRDLALMLGVSSFVDLDYPHFDTRPGLVTGQVSYLTAKQDWTAPQVIDTDKAGKPVLLMTRDSFSNELLPFLLPHFSRIVLAHNQDGFWRPDLIDRFKPDIVLLEVIEPGLRVGMGEGPQPTAAAVARIDGLLGRGGQTPSGRPLVPGLRAPGATAVAALAAARPTDNCHLESVTLSRGEGAEASLSVGGWISELGRSVTSPDGFVALAGSGVTLVAPLKVDRPRPDVAAYYKVPAGRDSGFASSFFAAALPKGAYTPSVYRRAGAGWIVCRGKAPLLVP